MDNGKIKTPKVLTTNNIREDARSWTLAGDVGLLAYLEQFSENVIARTQETQNRFTELVDDYDQLYTKVGNITNQFLALQNCQFVENRVYDEETPTEEKVEPKVQNEVEQEKLLLVQYKEAVEVGVKLLDSHFEEVELPPNSDSDDDDDASAGNSVIWKPRNPYASRKFPLLIGSAEWWADDHVGLRADEDILDTDKVISESDSDMESLKSIDKEIKSSSASSVENIKCPPSKPMFFDSSSEDLFGLDKNENLNNTTSEGFLFKGSNALLEEPETFLPDFNKEPTTDDKKRDDSLSIQQPDPLEEPSEETTTIHPKKVNNAFTRELMAKLGSVSNKKESGAKEEKREKEGAVVTAKSEVEGNNLFDETDDSSDLFFGNRDKMGDVGLRKKEDLFLETENEDDLFKGENDLFSGSSLFDSNGGRKAEVPPVFRNNEDDVSELEKPAETIQPKKTLVDDLFSDLDDYDTLFNAKSPKVETTDERLPSTGTGGSKTAKSVTGSDLDWDNDMGLFNSSTTEVYDDFFTSSDLFGTNPVVKTTKPSNESKNKKTDSGLFSEEHRRERQQNSEDVSPFVESGTKKLRGKEVGEEPYEFSPSKGEGRKKLNFLESEDDSDDDLFSKGLKEEKKPSVKVVTAFPDDEDTALFDEKPKPPDSVSVSSSRSSLFDDVSASKSRLASVFEKDKGSSKAEDDLFSLAEDSLFGGNTKTGKELFSGRPKEKVSLFEDCDDGDDLFGGEKSFGESVERSGSGLEEGEKQGAKALVGDRGDEELLKPGGTSKKLRETKSEILRHPEQKLFVEDVDDWDLFSSKEETGKPKPPNSLSLKSTGSEAKVKTVGKLNIPDNLKVRLESVAKHISSGGERHPKEEKKEEEKPKDVLDEPPQSSNLLKCPSKDRVKIPARRRPQSRRARQEAIRNSGLWDQPSLHTSQPSKDSLSSPAVSNPLSPSTDEEDFFKVPELDTNFEKEDQSIFKSDFFDSRKSSKPDDGLLFDGAPVLSPLNERTSDPPNSSKTSKLVPSSAGLFGDDDEDDDNDDLFKTSKPLGRQSLPKNEDKPRKSLFGQDSEDDEDDLFGGQSKKGTSGEMGRAKGSGGDVGVVEVQRGGPVSEGKEDGGDVVGGSEGSEGSEGSGFVDPLGLMTKQ